MQVVTLVLACFGILVLLLALSRWLAGRRWASLGHVVLAVTLLGAGLGIRPVAAQLATYEPRVAERPVAQLFCERTSSKSYRLTLTRLPRGRMQVFEVPGDEWRVDARTLDWTGAAAELGLGPSYRLEQLLTRYARPPGADDVPSSYPLSEAGSGGDLWSSARAGAYWSRHARAGQVDGPWQPLADGARFDVAFERGRLAARPANDAAARALGGAVPGG